MSGRNKNSLERGSLKVYMSDGIKKTEQIDFEENKEEIKEQHILPTPIEARTYVKSKTERLDPSTLTLNRAVESKKPTVLEMPRDYELKSNNNVSYPPPTTSNNHNSSSNGTTAYSNANSYDRDYDKKHE